MKSRPTQFGLREHTASPRQHASRLAVDSLSSKSEAIPRGSQHRQPTPVSTYRASESNMSIITMPLEAATGRETGDSAETFSAPTAVITAKESRQVLPSPERMLLAQEANAKSGCFGSRNSPCPSYGMRLRFQNQQNRVRSGLAVPAEKRSYVLSARITQESTPQGRRDLGAQIPGHESGRQKSRTHRNCRTCQGISQRRGRLARGR